jgi:hypothetical protein
LFHKGKGKTYAEVAAKISTLFALVATLKQNANSAVKAVRIPRRAGVLDTK